MRTSERLAVVTVAAMTVPAFLVFPALGLWYVMQVWPGMTWLDRGLFCGAGAALLVGTPRCFLRGLNRIKQGSAEGMAPTDRAFIYIPFLVGGWALTGRWDNLLVLSVWGLSNVYRAQRRQRRMVR